MSYLFAAYTVIWVLLFAYLVRLSRKQNEIEREIETLRKSLEKADSGA